MKPNIHRDISFSLAIAVWKHECFIPIKGTFITPHTQRKQGKVIGVGVHSYICLWMKKKLNRAIDSPFQTFAVGLLVEFID